jgi:plastocyanin
MTRLLRALLVPLTLAFGLPVALLAAPAEVLAGDPCYHDFDMPSRSVSTSPSIKTEPCAFSPTVTYVPVGTTVTFANAGAWTHLVTGANQEWGSRDEEVPAFGTVSYTFDQAGVYPYACALHRGMVGAIVVGADAAGGLAPSTGGAAPPAAAANTANGDAGIAQAADPGRLVPAAAVGGFIALAIAWIVRRARRAPVVKEIVQPDGGRTSV